MLPSDSQPRNVASRMYKALLGHRHQSYNVHKFQKRIDHVKKIGKGLRKHKSGDAWVLVHTLQSGQGGGIFDPDDRLSDVADDREQILAVYEEEGNGSHFNRADGTSASSEGTNSPDIFKGVEHRFAPFSRNDIEVTGEDIARGPSPLQVRRGSEPALNKLEAGLGPPPPFQHLGDNKRWSAAPVIRDEGTLEHLHMKDTSFMESDEEDEKQRSRAKERNADKTRVSSTSPFSRLNRDGTRLSMQILNEGRWLEAADKVVRREPLGGSESPVPSESPTHKGLLVVLKNENGPLGIHVLPDYDRSGSHKGLVIQRIESDGRVARDARLCLGDKIIEINSNSLVDISFQKAQEIFRDALSSKELRLRVIKCDPRTASREDIEMVEGQERLVGGSSKIATVTPTKKLGPGAAVLAGNTRKIGRILQVDLKKGVHGLGFSVTTRDNPAGGNAPIYIKNILPKGAAVEDGRLNSGDRLLEVNGIEMTGKSQADAVALLRSIPQNTLVKLTVSRQDTCTSNTSSPKLPRQMPTENGQEDTLTFPWKHREILTLDIPVHDTERAGLGVSVKGKTSNGQNGVVDLGIFVKSVIHGGAASKDGRLRPNDQLVNINGLSLLGKSNSEAMSTLRSAMHQEGPNPGAITLTVSRRIGGARSGRESVSSMISGSSGNTENLGGGKSRGASPDRPHDLSLDTTSPSRNPVIDRITGLNSLRNESYYMATNDCWNEQERPLPHSDVAPLHSPTLSPQSTNLLIIQDDPYGPGPPKPPRKSSARSGSRAATPENLLESPERTSHDMSDVAYASQTSLEDTGVGFSRDQPGRQSMSEKRHTTLDPKNTDTYQRNKRAREERERLKQQQKLQEEKKDPKDLGPALGLKKSSSLESLQTAVQEATMAEEKDPAYSYRPPPVRVVRGRGCNESFRAAVDRSYEAPLRSTMETLNEEESESGSSFGRGGPGNSRQSSLSSHQPPMVSTMSTNPNSTTLDPKKVPAAQKQKKSSILKGLGSMFRFGKHRSKTPEDENRAMKGRKNTTTPEPTRINQQARKLGHQNDTGDAVHNRSRSYELYGSEHLNRPGSRGPIQDPTPYSHYVNYEQIQQYLRPGRRKLFQLKLKSRQHIYQSERRRNEQAKDRPTSNYYEYESVQALINPSSTSSLPRRANNSKGYKPAPQNSNLGGFYKPKTTAAPPSGHYNHRYVVGPMTHTHYRNT